MNNIKYKTSGYCNECINTPQNIGNGFIEVIPLNYERTDLVLQRYTPYEYIDIIYTRRLYEGTDIWTDWESFSLKTAMCYQRNSLISFKDAKGETESTGYGGTMDIIAENINNYESGKIYSIDNGPTYTVIMNIAKNSTEYFSGIMFSYGQTGIYLFTFVKGLYSVTEYYR